MSMLTPLNGTLTHPLTPHAWVVLEELARAPIPVPQVNPGVRDRLERGGLAERVNLPSPYKTKPGSYPHLRITEVGRAALLNRPTA